MPPDRRWQPKGAPGGGDAASKTSENGVGGVPGGNGAGGGGGRSGKSVSKAAGQGAPAHVGGKESRGKKPAKSSGDGRGGGSSGSSLSSHAKGNGLEGQGVGSSVPSGAEGKGGGGGGGTGGGTLASSTGGRERRRKKRPKKHQTGGGGGVDPALETGGGDGSNTTAGKVEEQERLAAAELAQQQEVERRKRELEDAAQRAEAEALQRRIEEGKAWYVALCNSVDHRRALGQRNQQGNNLSEVDLRQLDSSLKKCTGFVRKLRAGINEESRDALLADIETLNLSRYTSEMVAAICESKLRTTDVDVIVVVCSKLHQRFRDFSHDLAPLLVKVVVGGYSSSPSSSSNSAGGGGGGGRPDAATRRGALRLLAELVCVGIVTDHCHVFNCVRELVKAVPETDKEAFLGNLSVLASFARTYKREFLDTALRNPYADILPLILHAISDEEQGRPEQPPQEQETPEKGEAIADDADSQNSTSSASGVGQSRIKEISDAEKSYVSSGVRDAIRNSLEAYYPVVCRQLESSQAAYKRAEAENIAVRQVRGEVPEEIATAYEREKKIFEKLLVGASSLAEGLDKVLPTFPEDEKTTRIVQMESRGAAATAAAASIASEKQEPAFEDEGERAFYESLPDLSDILPSEGVQEEGGSDSVEVCDPTEEARTKSEPKNAEGSEVGTTTTATTVQTTSTVTASMTSATATTTTTTTPAAASKPPLSSTSAVSSSSKKAKAGGGPAGSQADVLISKLHTCDSVEGTDTFAASFAVVANRGACRRLCRSMLSTPPQRLNVLPFYARLAASLSPHFPDVSNGLLQLLEDEFKQLTSRKDQDEKLLVVRVRNARFLGELVKFRLVPPATVFELVNRCLTDFTHHNVDVVCNILETCGRYLYRKADTAVRAGNMLDKMWRLKSVKNLDERHNSMVETAYFASRPPERNLLHPKKERDPLLEYVRRRLLYAEITRANFEWTLKQMKKLPWDHPLDDYIARLVLKTERLRFSSLNLTAPLIACVSKFREGFGIAVLDGLLESIRYGLETNDARMNQRRIAEMKLLGEFYNCRSIDSTLVFETLYLLITLGHDPTADVVAPDPYGDFFRARLVCVLLDTCSRHFDRGRVRKRLNVFLAYLECYLLLKSLQAGYGNKLPRDVEFLVTDTIESLRTGGRRPETLDEAQEEVAIIESTPSLAALVTLPRTDIAPGGPRAAQDVDSTKGAQRETSDKGVDEAEEEEDEEEEDDRKENTSEFEVEDDEMLSFENDEDEEDDDDEDESSEDHDVDGEMEDEEEEDDEEDEEDDEDDEEEDDDDEDAQVTVSMPEKAKTHEEVDFDRELDAMTAEFVSIAKSTKTVTTLERMALPMGLAARGGGGGGVGTSDAGGSGTTYPPSGGPTSGSTVAFRMLFRRAGKNLTKELALPAESALVAAAKESEDTERAQQQEMKRLVLGCNAVMSGEGGDKWSDTVTSDVSGDSARGSARKPKKSNDEVNILSALFKTNKPR